MKTETVRNWMIKAESENGSQYSAFLRARDAGEAWMEFDSRHKGVKWVSITVKGVIRSE